MKFSSWLIVGTIIIPALTGCSTSVTKKHLPSLAQLEKKDERVLKPVVLKEENSFKNDTVLEPEVPQGKRLPTLREQMQKIADEQASITTRHNELAEDVILVRQDMAQMKQSLEDIKSVLEEIRGAAPQQVSKGGGASEPEPAPRVLKSETVSDEILPDDVARETFEDDMIQPDNARKKTLKQASSKKKIIKENTFKKQAAEVKPVVSVPEKPVSEPIYQSAMSHFKKKNYSETIALLDGLLKTEKSSAVKTNCYYWMGESYFGLGQYSQAIGYFKKVAAFKSSEKSDDAQRMIAEAYAKGGNISEARRAFQKLIDVNPDSDLVPLARKRLQML